MRKEKAPFIVYGSKSLQSLHLPALVDFMLWLGIPTLAAIVLYYVSLSKTLLSDPWRVTKLTAYSIGLALLSLYGALFLSVNTFGE